MARTVVDSGTKETTVLLTEYTLVDNITSEGKVFDAAIDLTNLAAAESLEVRLYAKILAAGTLHRVYYQKYVGVQDGEAMLKSPIIYVPAMTVMKEWELTIRQYEGAARNYDWAVYSD